LNEPRLPFQLLSSLDINGCGRYSPAGPPPLFATPCLFLELSSSPRFARCRPLPTRFSCKTTETLSTDYNRSTPLVFVDRSERSAVSFFHVPIWFPVMFLRSDGLMALFSFLPARPPLRPSLLVPPEKNSSILLTRRHSCFAFPHFPLAIRVSKLVKIVKGGGLSSGRTHRLLRVFPGLDSCGNAVPTIDTASSRFILCSRTFSFQCLSIEAFSILTAFLFERILRSIKPKIRLLSPFDLSPRTFNATLGF